MSEAAIRAKIKTTISGVSGISLVYDYVRWAASWGDFLDLFKTDANKINGWVFSRKSSPTLQRTIGEIERAHVYVVRGYYGLKDEDATEKTFQALVEAVQAAFFTDETLGGACETTRPDTGPMAGAVGLQVDIVELRKFGTVLCHYFEGRLCAVESISD